MSNSKDYLAPTVDKPTELPPPPLTAATATGLPVSATAACSESTEANGQQSLHRSEALLPCPFCGSSDVGLNANATLIECENCYAIGPVSGEDEFDVPDEFDAIKAWNTRAGQVAGPVTTAERLADEWIETEDAIENYM